MHTQTQEIAGLMTQERLIARVSGFFGALVLSLVCMGLYGLLSYEVTRRTREIGIRMALGAEQRSVMRLLLRQGTTLALVGIVIGVLGALGSTRLIARLLFGVSPADLLTFAGVCGVLLAVALTACYIPARRATLVDPMVALRHE